MGLNMYPIHYCERIVPGACRVSLVDVLTLSCLSFLQVVYARSHSIKYVLFFSFFFFYKQIRLKHKLWLAESTCIDQYNAFNNALGWLTGLDSVSFQWSSSFVLRVVLIYPRSN